MSGKVCISGGTGMIGLALRALLLREGFDLSVLSRSAKDLKDARVYHWDVSAGKMEVEALAEADYVIHLAGANIGSGKWTDKRKKEIRDSRVESTRLLRENLSKLKKKPAAFIAASAIGIYGHHTGSILVNEERVKPGDDFMATITREWEEETMKIASSGIRVVILRTGPVLSTKGGALPKMTLPWKLGLGAPLGSGEQYFSWIHIDDLCRMYLYALNHQEMEGIYNAVAPHPETNADFSKKLARAMNKPFFMPNVPAFMLRLVFGEMASAILGGNRVSSGKIEKSGFEFSYPDLLPALLDIIENKK